ncbi:aldo/keto reductase [Actinomadura sp. KC345]|uniref:aldo/keto reductase n=1 Tax=Actinomadura sp. KC345 TaxID=2530371 RepID=UPI0010448ED2|nr:aldo/keto reductase [Actinomadura sp. KC345]TDC52504.1 aldo/keto reductase [Actinomadura sp. KC345]
MADHPSRRTVIKGAGGVALATAGWTAAGTGGAAAAAGPRDLLTRPFPGTGERVPAVGLGTFMTFDRLPHTPRAHLREVLRRFHAAGGRVVDTSALYGMSETNVGLFARQLGITDRLFVTDKSWVCGDYLNDVSHARRQFEQSLRRLHRRRLDAVQVHSLTNTPMVLPFLRELKEEGRIRYLGVTHHEIPEQAAAVERWIRTGDLDVVQVRYSIFMREAERRILPAAADHGTAVMVNMPLEKARLPELVRGRRLPGFAREIGCSTWAQFFLKYVLSHPAVTCVLPATTVPAHAEENAAAMRGPLPDQETRARMVRYLESISGFAELDGRPWYPGKEFTGGQVKL